MWSQTQFSGVFFKGDKIVKEEGLRIQRITEAVFWGEVYVDIKIPDREYDGFRIYLWNANSQKAIFINNIKVEYTEN